MSEDIYLNCANRGLPVDIAGMDVEELQRRIDNLSTDIVRQRTVLKDLERNKSAAQRELNAFRDPIARLPVEISSHIFLQCLPSHPHQPEALRVPMLFLNICNTWTEIALSTSQLWAVFHVNDPIPDLVSLMEASRKRASNRALSVSLPTDLPGTIAPILARNAHQLQDLKIFHREGDLALVANVGPFPILRNLTVVGLINAEDDMNQSVSPFWTSCASVPILSNAPSIFSSQKKIISKPSL
jgi:hypothetical protein